MGLFKDFKEDFSQAVNEMMPGNETSANDSKPEELVVNTLGEDVDVKKELSKLDGLLEQVKKDEEPAVKSTLETEIPNIMNLIDAVSKKAGDIPSILKKLEEAKQNLMYEKETEVSRGGQAVLSSMDAEAY